MAEAATVPVLDVKGLQAWYGESHILHGMDFQVRPGEVVTLLGRNGAGKSTTLKSIMGIIGKRRGSVKFEGRETINLSSDRIARLGVAFCPEERGIFASLDVKENLLLPPTIRPGGMPVERMQIARTPLGPNSADRLRLRASMAAQAGPIPPTLAAPRRAGSGVFISSTPDP